MKIVKYKNDIGSTYWFTLQKNYTVKAESLFFYTLIDDASNTIDVPKDKFELVFNDEDKLTNVELLTQEFSIGDSIEIINGDLIGENGIIKEKILIYNSHNVYRVYQEGRFDLYINDIDLKLESKPVDFLTAINARRQGKTIVCIYENMERVYQSNYAETSMAYSEKKILDGVWYIKD